MATVELIPPTTDAATERLSTGNYREVTIMASNIANAETVDIYIETPDGDLLTLAAWDGRTNAIDATNMAVTLVGGPDYYIDKSATAGSSGVYFAPVNNNG